MAVKLHIKLLFEESRSRDTYYFIEWKLLKQIWIIRTQTELNKWKQEINDLKIGNLKTNVKMDKNVRENEMSVDWHPKRY